MKLILNLTCPNSVFVHHITGYTTQQRHQHAAGCVVGIMPKLDTVTVMRKAMDNHLTICHS